MFIYIFILFLLFYICLYVVFILIIADLFKYNIRYMKSNIKKYVN